MSTTDSTNSTQEMSLGELSKQSKEWAEIFNNFVDGFSESYQTSYDEAMESGKSEFEAELAGLNK